MDIKDTLHESYAQLYPTNAGHNKSTVKENYLQSWSSWYSLANIPKGCSDWIGLNKPATYTLVNLHRKTVQCTVCQGLNFFTLKRLNLGQEICSGYPVEPTTSWNIKMIQQSDLYVPNTHQNHTLYLCCSHVHH